MSVCVCLALLVFALPAQAQLFGLPGTDTRSEPGWLGVSLEDTDEGEASVTRAFPGSPAARAGLSAGDVIVRIGDTPMGGASAVIAAVGAHGAGDTLQLTLRRGDAELVLSVTLDARVAPEALARALVGEPFPFVPVEDPIDGTPYARVPRAEATIVEFWATWCGPCHLAAPQMSAWVNAYGERLAVLAISSEEVEPVRQFLAQTDHIHWPVAVDPSGEASAQAMVMVLPTWFVLDAAGHVVSVHTGADELEAVGRSLEALLAPSPEDEPSATEPSATEPSATEPIVPVPIQRVRPFPEPIPARR